jgi:hypothetical protein
LWLLVATMLMAIGGYWWVLMFIVWMAIGDYYINGYLCLFYY